MKKKKIYAVVDLETTGGKASMEKVIEVAIVLFDGENILDKWESLVHPERTIPSSITRITGINDEMVVDAPKFYEVAKKIVEMTEGAIFVAHNVRFDYLFLREEFQRLGFTFSRKQLCTVRLSRMAFPGLRSYGLSNLIRHFKIPIKNRHRAMGDTLATVDVLRRILTNDSNIESVQDLINLGVKESRLPKNIDIETLHALPEECGVYFFHDMDGDVAYIGKSSNIKKRVAQHFAKASSKASKLQRHVDDISFELTGSELIALLYESQLIKEMKPYINRAQRNTQFPFMIHSFLDAHGYLTFSIARNNIKNRKQFNMISEYTSQGSAKGFLARVREEFELCATLCDLDSRRPCFNFHIHQCQGACKQEEPAEEYNERASEAIEKLSTVFEDDFFILDKGRNKEELSVILIQDKVCKGFGYIDKDYSGSYIETLLDCIKPYPAYPETTRIIRRFLKKNKGLKIVKLDKRYQEEVF